MHPEPQPIELSPAKARRSEPMSWAARIARHAVWPLLLILAFVLFTRGLEMAKTAGCQPGETCISGAGIEASLYIACAVLIGIVIAGYLVVFLAWRGIKLVLKLARTKPQDQEH